MQNSPKLTNHLRFIGLVVGFTLFVLFAFYSGQTNTDAATIKGMPFLERMHVSAYGTEYAFDLDAQTVASVQAVETPPSKVEQAKSDSAKVAKENITKAAGASMEATADTAPASRGKALGLSKQSD